MTDSFEKLFKGINTDDPLLKAPIVADMTGLACQTLAAWRHRGDHSLPWVKLGRRAIRYRLSDVRKFIEENRRA